MTLVFRVGRRVPKKWFKRFGESLGKLITFQEHIWTIIIQSLRKAKKAINKSGMGTCETVRELESEDLNYQIEWVKVIIKGDEDFEKGEYEDLQKMYGPLKQIFKKEIPKNELMAKRIRSKILAQTKIDEAYKQGFGAVSSDNISNKLLEMGILTHIQWDKDFKVAKKVE